MRYLLLALLLSGCAFDDYKVTGSVGYIGKYGDYTLSANNQKEIDFQAKMKARAEDAKNMRPPK